MGMRIEFSLECNCVLLMSPRVGGEMKIRNFARSSYRLRYCCVLGARENYFFGFKFTTN